MSNSCNLACRHCWITPAFVDGEPSPGDCLDVDLLREASNADEFAFEETQIGGRDVTLIRESPESQGVLVVIGDAAYALELPPEIERPHPFFRTAPASRHG